MSIPVKGILGGASLLGGGCAAAIPLALGAPSSRYSAGPTIELTQCEGGGSSNNLGEINYGDSDLQKVCGKNTETSGVQTNNIQDERYTTLFRSNGGQDSRNGEVGAENAKGMSQCLGESGSNQGGVVVVSDSDSSPPAAKHFGFCDGSSGSNTIFIKKQETHQIRGDVSSKLSFGTCTNDCGTTPTSASGPFTLTQEKSDNGREVKFYNKEIGQVTEKVA